MRVEREKLLSQLQSVTPGISAKGILEQSGSIVFSNGNVLTFNDEVSCSSPCDLKDVEGAIVAGTLVDILSKMREKELVFVQKDGQLKARGNRRRFTIAMEKQIKLPVDEVEKPTEWNALPNEFCEAIKVVSSCTGKDASKFLTLCVHMHPEHIEATDNVQIARYPLRLEGCLEKGILIRAASLKFVTEADVTEFCETKSWAHFRNPNGLVISVRLARKKYKELDAFFKIEGGKRIELPKGLGEAVERAEVFTNDNADVGPVLIGLKPGAMHIKGVGASGEYEEFKDIKYKGPRLRFTMSPKILVDLANRDSSRTYITESRLKIDSGSYLYITVLGRSEEE